MTEDQLKSHNKNLGNFPDFPDFPIFPKIGQVLIYLITVHKCAILRILNFLKNPILVSQSWNHAKTRKFIAA